MERRDYLRRVGAACGAAGLAGCSVLGGGETPTPEDDVATGTVQIDRSTPTPTPAPVEMTDQLRAAVDAAGTARSTFQRGGEAATTLEADATYTFEGGRLESDVSALESELSAVESERARATLQSLADYLGSAASVLTTVEAPVERLVGIVDDLVESVVLPTGAGRGRELDGIQSTLDGALGTLEEMAATRRGLDPVGNVLASESIAELGGTRERLASQLRGLSRLAEALRTYLDAATRYVQAEQHRQNAGEAGTDESEEMDRQLELAVEDYAAAESLFREAASTLASLSVSAGATLSAHIGRLECRMGAFADASDRWRAFAQLVVDRAAESDIRAAEAAAREALQRCED